MIGKTCCVTGHREIRDSLVDEVKRQLRIEVDIAIADGFTTFISGFADGIDLYFAEIVAGKRREYPALFLEAAIPYANRLKNGGIYFQSLLKECDGIQIHSAEYSPGCFQKRNQAMVQRSHRVIGVYDGRGRSGTFSTLQYANSLRKEIHLIKIEGR